MTVLVTGASGFVGQHLVLALTHRHPATRVRTFDVARPVEPPDAVDAFYGRIEEPERLPEVLDGVAAVVHLAAKVQPDSRGAPELWQVNVDGARNVYSAAVQAGCDLFLHISSAGVYGPPRRRDPFQEVDPPSPVTPYQRTKWEAEQALRRIDSAKTTLNILRPAGIYGPGSHLEIPQYERVRKQRLVLEIAGGVVVHPTYVDDIVNAILAIITEPAPHGTVFNLGGERALQLQDLQAMVAETLGVTRRRLVVPTRLAGPLSALAEPVLALKGRPNPLLRAMCRGELFSAAVDDRRFRRRYPHVPVSNLREGLRKHVEWASAQQLL